MFSAVLAREIARRMEDVDYRALAAASFLGLGSVWAQGLSGSAALQMATPGALNRRLATSWPPARSCRAASSASRRDVMGCTIVVFFALLPVVLLLVTVLGRTLPYPL